MEQKLLKYTFVKNKREGYKGWIDGTTIMKELFTGNKETEWKYRIIVKGKEERNVAPEEDLQVIADSAEFPPHLLYLYGKKQSWQEESKLHALGYQITDMNSSERWEILINLGVPMLGVVEVIDTILKIMEPRSIYKEDALKHHHALTEWMKDIEMLIDRYGDDSQLKTHPDLVQKFNDLKYSLNDIGIGKREIK